MVKKKKHYITESERWRSCVTQEGPFSSTQTSIDIRITESHSVLQLVEAILKHSKPE